MIITAYDHVIQEHLELVWSNLEKFDMPTREVLELG